MEENQELDPAEFRSAMKKIRQRRWLLWGTIIIYMPVMMLALQSEGGWNTVVKAFIAWIILLCIVVALAVVVRCPACGNCFHTHGPTFLPVRHCVHCGLHISADKRQNRSTENDSG